VFLEQRCVGTLQLWAEPFVKLRVPKLFNLRTDPFENADLTSNTYWQWLMENAFIVAASQHVMREFLLTFLEYPPRQKAATFTVDQALEMLTDALKSGA
jgi:arylsulfatase